MNLLLIGSSSIGFGFQGRFSLVFKVREEGKEKREGERRGKLGEKKGGREE